jgi:hypothetical protein
VASMLACAEAGADVVDVIHAEFQTKNTCTGLPDLSLYNIPKRGKYIPNYQN